MVANSAGIQILNIYLEIYFLWRLLPFAIDIFEIATLYYYGRKKQVQLYTLCQDFPRQIGRNRFTQLFSGAHSHY